MDGSGTVRTPVSVPAHPVGGVYTRPAACVPVHAPPHPADDRLPGLAELKAIDPGMMGPWFGALQSVVLGLVRELENMRGEANSLRSESEQLRAMLGFNPTNDSPLTKLNYERTAVYRPVPLSDQILELQRLVMRSLTGTRSLALFGLLKDEGKVLRSIYFRKWVRFARRNHLATMLLSDCRSAMASRYFKKWAEFTKCLRRFKQRGRTANLLLRSTARGLLLLYYQKWRGRLSSRQSRYPVARRLAILNGKIFVHRYWKMLEAFPYRMRRRRARWHHLLWMARVATKRLALNYFKKLRWYQAKRPAFQQAPVILGSKHDKRVALAHALTMNNANLMRRVYFKKWVKFRWLIRRGGVASKLAVIRDKEMLQRYVERLRKYGGIVKIAKMERQLDASLEALSSTNGVVDKLMDRLVAVENVLDNFRTPSNLQRTATPTQFLDHGGGGGYNTPLTLLDHPPYSTTALPETLPGGEPFQLRNCSPPRQPSPISLPHPLRGIRGSRVPPGPPTQSGPITRGSRSPPKIGGSFRLPETDWMRPTSLSQHPPPQPYHYQWN